jgi:hypothetical protein
MLKLIVIALVVIVVAFVIVVTMQPAEFRVSRGTKMSASAPAAYVLVNELHNWEKWNPWQKVDPAMKMTFSGPAAGPGAAYAWAGNKDVGEGRLSIMESRPNELVKVKLEFLKPFTATNTAEFTFKPEGNQTAVTWSMYGGKNFISKAMGLFMNMDKMVGDQFEKGLADMKAAAEAAPRQ